VKALTAALIASAMLALAACQTSGSVYVGADGGAHKRLR
jgi:hypothetical protein